MKTPSILLLVYSLLSFSAFSQEIIFEEEVKENRYMNFGQNMRHFAHSFADVAFIATANLLNQTDIQVGSSGKFGYGIRYKLKLTRWFAVGADTELSLYSVYFSVPQNDENFASVPYDNEQYCSFQAFEINPYLRINFGKRGNIIGKYIDLGTGNALNFNNRYIEKYKIAGADEVIQRVKTTTAKSAISRFTGFAFVRLGINRNSIFFNYRYTNLQLSNKTAIIPPFTVGLQLGLIR